MYPCPLTPRQKEIAALIAMGFTAPQIGAVLGISPRSVEFYTHRIYRRWGVANRTAVMRMVWREELRVEAALSGKPPALPAPIGTWREFYCYLIHALANYGLACQRVQISNRSQQ